MSAPSCVAVIGLRFQVTDDELEALEERRDIRLVEARNAGLKVYWGNFGGEAPRYTLLVGTQLGSLGAEGQSSLSLTAEEFTSVVERTREQLASTTMDGDVGLYIEFHPD